MDFFEHQDQAKKASRRFVLLFAIAVVAITLAVAAAAALLGYSVSNDVPHNPGARTQAAVIAAVLAAAATLVIIAAGALHRVAQLRGGGANVARALGGRLIRTNTNDPDERRALNVVEEMALASGIPVPPVYILPKEARINAFAAGYKPDDAIVAFSAGAIHNLTRDELQGVAAHEFSHILHGDMRLNIRMLALLSGIVLISVSGAIVMRNAFLAGRGRNGLQAMIALLAIGATLAALGSIGALAAKLIQSATSRQREYLADAAAVQFTRNPHGIADALRRIGGTKGTSKLKHPRAQEAGHMFFSTGRSLSSALATHPPLKERITRVLPSWDGTFLEPEQQPATPLEKVQQTTQDKIRERLERAAENPVETILPLLALSGTMTPAHIDHARATILAIPANLRDAAHDTSQARAVVYALLLDRTDHAVLSRQLDHLRDNADPAIADITSSLAPAATSLPREHRLPLLDMTLAALANLTDDQHERFRTNTRVLTGADNTIDLFEWVTARALERHLDHRFHPAPKARPQYYALKQLDNELSVLLSALARAGAKDPDAAQHAFDLASNQLENTTPTLRPKDQCTLDAVDNALATLNLVSPKLKKQILTAAALTVGADKQITTTEAELLRAVADALDVPTPPLLPGQQLA